MILVLETLSDKLCKCHLCMYDPFIGKNYRLLIIRNMHKVGIGFKEYKKGKFSSSVFEPDNKEHEDEYKKIFEEYKNLVSFLGVVEISI